MRSSILLLLVLSGYASAHSWTPTYPTFSTSYIDNVLETDMLLFNKRTDVTYFEVQVTDKDFNALPFVSSSRIYKVEYLERKKIKIYIREESLQEVTYICSKSRFLEQVIPANLVTSRICSKLK